MALDLLARYREMYRMRRFDERVLEALGTGDITGEIHLAIGQEAIAAGMAGTMRDSDALVSTHRPHFHALAKGVPVGPLVAELFHRESGLCRGRGGHMHLFDPDRRFSTTGIVGASLPVALGYAYESWLRERDDVAVAIVGDGGVATGAFHESLNLAAVWRLPYVVVCENNLYGISVPVADTCPTPTIAERATSYGAWGRTVDGMDVEEVAAAFADAVAHARAGNGPALLEAVAYRFRGHYEGDADLHRSESEKKDWLGRDPLPRTRAKLQAHGIPESGLAGLERDVDAELDAAFDAARAAPLPDPADASRYVFAGR